MRPLTKRERSASLACNLLIITILAAGLYRALAMDGVKVIINALFDDHSARDPVTRVP